MRLASLILLFVTILAGAFREQDLMAVQSRRAPTLEPIDGPQAKATIASAINSHGEIVGRYTLPDEAMFDGSRDCAGTERTYRTLRQDPSGLKLVIDRAAASVPVPRSFSKTTPS